MPGSDDEFSDLQGEEMDDGDDEPLTSPTQQASSSPSPLPADWSSSLQQFTIDDFTALVGPNPWDSRWSVQFVSVIPGYNRRAEQPVCRAADERR